MEQARAAWLRAMLASPSPVHRVEALEEAGRGVESGSGGAQGSHLSESGKPGRHAALILSYLERLGEPYGPPEVRFDSPVILAAIGCQRIGSMVEKTRATVSRKEPKP